MNNTAVGERIESRRQQLNLTLDDIATEIGVARSTVQRYEKGSIKKIKMPVIEAIARVLDVDPAWLCCKTDDMTPKKTYTTLPANIISMPSAHKIPLIGTIACGKPILAVEEADELVSAPDFIHADFALRCQGDSMINARIFDGDVVYIRKQPEVENGQIAAVLIGEEATLKRVTVYPNKIVLEAANPLYDPLIYRDEEMNQVEILGKAVGFTSLIS